MQKALIVVQPNELGEIKRAMSTGLTTIAAEYTSAVDEAEYLLGCHDYELLITTIEDRNDPHSALVHRCDKEHPSTARLILSDDSKVRDRVPAHLAMKKRLTGRELQAGILGALRWRDRLGHAKLSELIAGARKLPSLPDVYLQVQRELNSSDPSMHRVGEIVQSDPALATTILRVVNSAMFGLRQDVGDVVQAVALLGAKTISSLVLAAGMFSTAAIDQKLTSQLWRDALTVGSIARKIALDAGLGRSDVEESHLAGLVHDIGDIVLLQHWPTEFRAVEVERRSDSEREIFGATHADIGGYLATLWALPPMVIDAVTNHHTPSQGKHQRFISPTTAVHVARAFVDCGGDLSKAVFDLDHLRDTGAGPKVERWFALGNPSAVAA